jgi:uncharacterized protein
MNSILDWSQLGNIREGRPNLGLNTSVEMYRLLQYSMRAVLEDEWDDETARRILYKSGQLAGSAFAGEYLDKTKPLNAFLASFQLKLEELGVGILKVEKSDAKNLLFTVTVSEDLDCSGLPVNGTTVCDFDEGFLEGVFSFYTGKPFNVREIDCWSTGDRTCRFDIKPMK